MLSALDPILEVGTDEQRDGPPTPRSEPAERKPSSTMEFEEDTTPTTPTFPVKKKKSRSSRTSPRHFVAATSPKPSTKAKVTKGKITSRATLDLEMAKCRSALMAFESDTTYLDSVIDQAEAFNTRLGELQELLISGDFPSETELEESVAQLKQDYQRTGHDFDQRRFIAEKIRLTEAHLARERRFNQGVDSTHPSSRVVLDYEIEKCRSILAQFGSDTLNFEQIVIDHAEAASRRLEELEALVPEFPAEDVLAARLASAEAEYAKSARQFAKRRELAHEISDLQAAIRAEQRDSVALEPLNVKQLEAITSYDGGDHEEEEENEDEDKSSMWFFDMLTLKGVQPPANE